MAIIGIDLGTTNSLVSIYKDGEIIFIPNQFGEILTPSVVHMKDGIVTVGKIAKERLITDPKHTVSAFKVHMGSAKTYQIDGNTYTPIDLSSMIIKQLVNDARTYLNEEIDEVIMSVPAYFNDAKRLATKQAGELAGVKVERIINEPSAAALASRIDQTDFETLLVFDFGGGTLDVSVVDCFDDVVEIIAVNGDNHLGGEDFNRLIEAYFKEKYQIPELNVKDQAILLHQIENIKKELSIKEEVTKSIYLNEKLYDLYLSRDILLNISEKILFKIKNIIGKALKDANMTVESIHRLIMVGGSSRLIVIQEYLEYLFHQKPEISHEVDYLVGKGCGYVAGIKARNIDIKDKVLTDICPFSLGVNIYNHGKGELFSIIIERNATLPCTKKQYYTTIRDNQTRIVSSIYQGESMLVNDNELIGTMEINVPSAPAGQETIETCFTYDINGILDVEITSMSTNEKVHQVFTSAQCVLSKEELEIRMSELEDMKQKNSEHQDLEYLIEKAKRIYEENIGAKRDRVAELMAYLDQVYRSGKIARLEKIKQVIEAELDAIDGFSPFVYESEDVLN